MRPSLATGVLVAGVLAGAVVAAAGILERPPGGADLAEGVVAQVGDMPILQADYERALRAVAADRRGAVGADEARHVLDRLIDEELLVQRGVELGLAERDPRLRAELSSAVIGMIVARAEAEAAEPEDAALRAFYEEDGWAFREPTRYRVERVRVAVAADPASGAAEAREADEAARRRAEALRDRLVAGEDAEWVAADADPAVAALPEGWLEADTLLEYLGPSAATAVAELEQGGVTEPVRGAGGYEVVRLVARRDGPQRAFEDVRDEVREAYRRRAGEVALQEFLEARRREVEIVVAGEPREHAP